MPLGALRSLTLQIDSNAREAAAELRMLNGDAAATGQSLRQVYLNAGYTAASVRDLKLAFGAAAIGAVGLGLALAKIASAGMEIERTFSEVQATTGATEETMGQLVDQAEYLGARLPVTLGQAARAFREMSFAGFSAQEAIDSSVAAVNLAVTGGLEMEQAARTVTSTVNAFRLEADQAGQVVNAMASVFADSAVNIEEMTHSLQYASSAAYQADQTITDVTASLGVLGDVGLRASKAGTGMQQIFARIADPANRATEAMEKIGVAQEDFLDEQGNFRSMYEIMGVLNEATQDLPSAERMEALTAIFRARGARAAAPLIANYEEIADKMEQVAAASVSDSIAEMQTLDEEMRQVANEELIGVGAEFRVRPDLDTESVVKQFHKMGQRMDLSQLTMEAQHGLGLDEQSAEIFARSVQQTDNIEGLITTYEEATTVADLASAQIETVSGSIEYLAGSLSSSMYQAYQVIQPGLMWLLMRLRSLADLIVDHPIVSKTFGAALIAMAGAAVFAAGALGLTVAELTWLQIKSGHAAASTYGYVAATKAASFATSVYNGAVLLLTGSITDITKAMKSLTIVEYASSSSALAAAKSKGILGTAAYVAGGGVAVLTNALRAMWTTLGPIGWAVIAVSAAFLLWNSHIKDFLGLGDRVSGVMEGISGAISFTIQFVKDLIWIFNTLGDAIVSGGLGLISAGIEKLLSYGKGLLNWFDSLNTLGKAVMTIFMPMTAALWALMTGAQMAKAGLAELKEILSGMLTTAWQGFVAAVEDGVKWFFDILRAFKNQFLELVRFFTWVEDTAVAIGENLRRLFNLIEADPEAAIDLTFSLVSTTWEGLKGAVKKSLMHVDWMAVIGAALIPVFPMAGIAVLIGVLFKEALKLVDLSGIEDSLTSMAQSINWGKVLLGVLAVIFTFAFPHAAVAGWVTYGLYKAFTAINWQDAFDPLANAFKYVVGLFQAIPDAIESRLPRTAAALRTIFGGIGSTIRILTSAWNALTDAFDREITQPVSDGLDDLNQKWEWFKNRVGGAIRMALVTPAVWFGGGVKRFLNWLGFDIGGGGGDDGETVVERDIIPDLSVDWGSVWSGFVDGFWASLDALIAGLLSPLRLLGYGMQILEAMLLGDSGADTDMLSEAGSDAVAAMADGIRAVPALLTNALADTLYDMIPFLPGSDAQRGPLSDLTDRGEGIVRALATGVKNAPGVLRDALVDRFGWLEWILPGSDADRGPLSTLTERGAGIIDALASGVRENSALERALETAFSNLNIVSLAGQGLETILGGLQSSLSTAGDLFYDSIVGGADKTGSMLLDAVDTVQSSAFGDIVGRVEPAQLTGPVQQPVETGQRMADATLAGQVANQIREQAGGQNTTIQVDQTFDQNFNGMDPEEVAERVEGSIPTSSDLSKDIERELKRDNHFFG